MQLSPLSPIFIFPLSFIYFKHFIYPIFFPLLCTFLFFLSVSLSLLSAYLPLPFFDLCWQTLSGDSSVNPCLGRLVLQCLCPALRNLLCDGLKPHQSDLIAGRRPNSPWGLVQASTKPGIRHLDLVYKMITVNKYLFFLSLHFSSSLFLFFYFLALWIPAVLTHPSLSYFQSLNIPWFSPSVFFLFVAYVYCLMFSIALQHDFSTLFTMVHIHSVAISSILK